MSIEGALDIKRRSDADRIVYEYDLPDECVALDDKYIKKTIGMRKLKMSEEIAATERIKGNQSKLAFNFARYSLVEVDGRVINKSEGEDETILENVDPAIRELILTAFADMSSIKDENGGVTKKFLASRRTKTT